MNYLTSLKSECDLKLPQEQKVEENKTTVRIAASVFINKKILYTDLKLMRVFVLFLVI